jgi:hypothetical protein
VTSVYGRANVFEICFDWEDAVGVAEPMLRQTWAFLRFRLDRRPVMRFWNDRTCSFQDGVYVSVLPLAQWIVDNKRHLLNEGLPPSLPTDVASVRGPMVRELREWLLRHNVFTCREGMAYPDLAIFREKHQVAMRWFRDPPQVTTPGRFVDEGAALVECSEMETALDVFVQRVFERIHVPQSRRA